MGIYDREYYRREGPSILGSFSERGQICKWLIAINVVLFVLQHLSPVYQPKPPAHEPVAVNEEDSSDNEQDSVGPARQQGQVRQAQRDATHSVVTEALLLDADKVLHGQVWRLLTYAFLHDPYNYMHILFNMLFLWWFGSDVEDLYGPKEFLLFYLLSAVVGGVCFTMAW